MIGAVPKDMQQKFWNDWNASTREIALDEVSFRQAREIVAGLTSLGRRDLNIIEVGCGAGWLCPQLTPFGRVTATDLSDEVLARAQTRLPEVRFIAGDFMALPFAAGSFDVVVTLEVLAHVPDQSAFLAKLAALLRPGGYLLMATQNRTVLERYNSLPPPGEGQLRQWVDAAQLRQLLEPCFEVHQLYSVTPRANRGVWRYLHSRTFNRPIRFLVGDRVDRLKEQMGLGWTLMVRAQKPKPA